MKLTLKNLKQVQFEIEIPSEKSTIKELKNEIEKKYEFDSNLIKLLHNGKVLEDGKTLESYEIKEGNVVIMMNTKPKQKAQPPKEEKPEPQKVEDKQNKESQPQNNQESQNSKYTEQINSLVEMGYERDKIEKALNAAQGNINLAIEFLTTGEIPEVPLVNPQNQQNQNNNSNNSNLPQDLKLHAGLLKIFCLNDPDKVVGFLNDIKTKDPALLNLIKQHEEAFKNYIMSPINQEDIDTFKRIQESARRPRQPLIRLTKEEGEAVERLRKLGDFTKEEVIQAYIACDKNEELAANYLFEQKLRDDEEKNKNNNNNKQGQ